MFGVHGVTGQTAHRFYAVLDGKASANERSYSMFIGINAYGGGSPLPERPFANDKDMTGVGNLQSHLEAQLPRAVGLLIAFRIPRP